MKSLMTILALLAASPATAADAEGLAIQRNGASPSRPGPEANFTGKVRVDTPFQAASPARVGGGIVTFEPGARTAWHTHPLGQTLIIVSGLGWVQREGGPIQEVRPGDVVWIPPQVRHWHGAGATTAMSHVAIAESLDGSAVQWMEQVPETTYRAGPAGAAQ